MSDSRISISRDQRDEIVKALGAIGRRVQDMVGRPGTQADVFVIWTNLTIIETIVTNLPQIASN